MNITLSKTFRTLLTFFKLVKDSLNRLISNPVIMVVNRSNKEVHAEAFVVTHGAATSLDSTRPTINLTPRISKSHNKERLNFAKLEAELKITQEKLEEAKQQIGTLTESLVKSAKSLEATESLLSQYGFLSNHDLQEPLRKIQMFSDLLLRPDAHLNRYAIKYARKVGVAASRMSLLLKDLTTFSNSFSRDVMKKKTIDLNAIVQQAVKSFNSASHRNAVITWDKLPVIEGDALQVSQVVHALLTNALNFTTENAIVHISGRKGTRSDFQDYPSLNPSTRYICIEISDNGIGFNQLYATKIFSLFQRLGNKTNIGGSGTGLAICKQIMQNHDGMIFAAGKENQGALFVLFFPVADRRMHLALPPNVKYKTILAVAPSLN